MAITINVQMFGQGKLMLFGMMGVLVALDTWMAITVKGMRFAMN